VKGAEVLAIIGKPGYKDPGIVPEQKEIDDPSLEGKDEIRFY